MHLLTPRAGYLSIAEAAVYQFSLDLGHATSYFISSIGPNDGAILALDGDDLIAMNGAIALVWVWHRHFSATRHGVQRTNVSSRSRCCTQSTSGP